MAREADWWLLRAPVIRDKELLAEVEKWAKQEKRSRANAIKYLVALGLAQARKKGGHSESR